MNTNTQIVRFFGLLLLFLFVGGQVAWAQPRSMSVDSDGSKVCRGETVISFKAGYDKSNTIDDEYIDYATLYMTVNGNKHRLAYIDGHDYDNFDRRKYSKIDRIEHVSDGRDRIMYIYLENLTELSEGDIEFQLIGKWKEITFWGPNKTEDINISKTLNKKDFINVITTTAQRDDCDLDEVKVTYNASIACNPSGFTYYTKVQKDDNLDFNSPTDLTSWVGHDASSASSTIVGTFIDNNAGNETTYYRTLIDYQTTGLTAPTVYQSEISSNATVRKVDVISPVLDEVSKDICDNKIKLKWHHAAQEASHFEIYRSDNTTDSSYDKIAEVSGRDKEYTDDSVEGGHTYSYVVTATQECQGNISESKYSNAREGFSPTIPNAPTDLTVTPDVQVNAIRLNWQDNATDEMNYEIRRFHGDETTIYHADANATSFIDENIIACRLYSYVVRASNECGVSEQRIENQTHLDPSIEEALAEDNFDASKGKHINRVELRWKPENNAQNILDRYRVYRKALEDPEDPAQIDVIPASANVYRDEAADAGILYEYTLVGELDCAGQVLVSNRISSIGFRTATGLVAGQVTYEGGNVVKGAKVLVASVDNQQIGKSLKLDGIDDVMGTGYLDTIDNVGGITLEAWIHPNSLDGERYIISNQSEEDGFYGLDLRDGKLLMKVKIDDEWKEIVSTTPLLNSWQHVAGTYNGTELKLFINGQEEASNSVSGSIDPFYTNLSIGGSVDGNYFHGLIDEVRIWNKARSSEEITRDYNRILNPDEQGLIASYSFDEGIGFGVYDRSKTGRIFNEHHGRIIGVTDLREAWSENIPTPDQLSLYGITDESGNYTIAAIPYSGVGQSFKVVPKFETHSFEPSQTNIFVGPRSDIFNGTNFKDISSFPVTGTIFYKGTSCPADQIEIHVDGQPALINGEPVTTNTNGAFLVDVPIGRHRISVFKEGHQFEVGRFPTDGSLHDFQEPISGLEFIDTTQLKVIGRVVGGTREGNKVPGLGRSVNNIGKARVVYEALVGNGCHRDTVFTDPQTGEYATSLYPLKYVVKDVRVTNSEQNISTSDFFEALPQIDLVNAGELRTVRDTSFNAASSVAIEHIDSVSYHYLQNFIYRNIAEIEVLEENKNRPFFGDDSYSFSVGIRDTTYENLTDNSDLSYPIFKRASTYRAYVNVFERYNNLDEDAPLAEDKVPVTDGKLVINNQLASDNQQTLNIAITDGDTLYTFVAGKPSFERDNNDPRFSYTKTLDMTLQRPGQVEDVKWEPNEGERSRDRVFRAYLLGQADIIGTNFVTQGPEMPRIVLRDPPGDNSTASFTEESTFQLTESFSLSDKTSAAFNSEITAGAKTEVGIGTSTEIEATATTSDKIQVDVEVKGNFQLSQTWSTSETISTNGNEEAVGTRSDLYIGEQYNLLFGMVNNLELIPNEVCNTTSLDCYEIDPDLPFQIGVRKGFRISPSKEKTTFVYDHNHIVNYLIPNLKSIRNRFFIEQSEKYNSRLPPENKNYGLNNDDPVFGEAVVDPNKQSIIDDLLSLVKYGSEDEIPIAKKAAAFINNPFVTDQEDRSGTSYIWTGQADEKYGIATDSVRYYNQQIRLWETAIAENERDKLHAISGSNGIDIPDIPDILDTLANLVNNNNFNKNFSFSGGAGAIHESSSYASSFGASVAVEFAVSEEIAAKFKAEVAGNGTELGIEASGTVSINIDIGGSKENKTTWEYTLDDNDQGDAHNVHVYDSPRGWGPIFKTLAGQTSCPYEGADSTLYIQNYLDINKQQLNQSTRQRDHIEIEISPNIVQNVPEGEAAVFNVSLENKSIDPRIYAIRVDPNSNPDGLQVFMDGKSITEAIQFPLRPESVLTKAITVRRGPEKYDYEGIRILAFTPCQFEAGTSDEVDLVDAIEFDVSFLPECTDIRLKEPTDLWVVNNFNQDTLPMVIDNYDINKNGFDAISLQYKPAAEATWRELNKWWHPINKAEEEGDQIPTSTSFIRYNWDMSSNVDGPYELRVVSECELVERATEFKQGVADRINPQAFGTPSPGDGIADPGEDLKIQFNEPIEIGSLTSLNFDIRGVLNGTELRHSESIALEGDDYLSIPAFDLTKRSFAAEFWIKRDAEGRQSIISQGESNNGGLHIEFDQNNNIVFSLAGQNVSSEESIPADTWKHITLSFDAANNTATLFIDGEQKGVNNNFNTPYTIKGEIRIGLPNEAGLGFNGNIHELRLWSTPRTSIDIVPTMNVTLPPSKAGLMGYWPMNEGIGNIAEEKVRKRNAVLNGAIWAISPVGQSFSLNGTDQYLEVGNAGTLALDKESDITIESWFKTSTAGTLLSNGKGDASDTETSWTIGLDELGKMVVSNDSVQLVSNASGYLDNSWHHLAVVLKRNSAMNIYLDGKLLQSEDSKDWQAFAGSKLWIGARGWFEGTTEMRDQYFNGSLDEIRIWNLARQPKQIERDRTHRLLGDELGLMAYYPFESYVLDAGVPILMESLKDESENEYDLNQNGGDYIQPTPPIKLPRPIEKVNFTYIVNNDEIIMTPTDPAARIEHVTLDVTVKEVKDNFGNIMQSPVTWIAFMNKNQVKWDRDHLEMAMKYGDSEIFETSIVNSGGSEKDFEILNIPTWMRVTPSSGTIAPNSELTVKVEILDGTNIGEYEQDLFLSTDFGYNERFILDLKVSATPPSWSVNPAYFSDNMTYVGQLEINGVISTDSEDMLAAFIGGEVRGIAPVELDPTSDKYLVFLDVHSQYTAEIQQLEFRIWDASEGRVYTSVSPSDRNFEFDQSTGTRVNPQIFSVTNEIEQIYNLEAGWNWISFPLSSDLLSDIDTILNPNNDPTFDYAFIYSQDYQIDTCFIAQNGTSTGEDSGGSGDNGGTDTGSEGDAIVLNFDGINDHVDAGNILTPSYTKELWVNLVGSTNPQHFISGEIKRVQGDLKGHGFLVEKNKVSAGHDRNWYQVQDPENIDDGWQHYAVTYDAAAREMKLYKNGRLVDQATNVPGYGGVNSVFLGAFQRTIHLFKGQMDEVRIWNFAKTEAQIRTQKDCGLTGSEDGLIAYYDFNQGSPGEDNVGINLLEDRSTNGNNGLLEHFSLSGETSNWVSGRNSCGSSGNGGGDRNGDDNEDDSNNNSDFSCEGYLSDNIGFNRRASYRIFVEQPVTFSYNGIFNPPSDDPIALNLGWNWIGFISQQNMEVSTALASLNPSNGDIIKGQRTFAVYEDNLGWGGSLTHLEPTEGYMLFTQDTSILVYPDASNSNALPPNLEKSKQRLLVLEAQMEIPVTSYKESMSIAGTISNCSNLSLQQQIYLAAYVGEECRGVAPIESVGKEHVVYLTVYGNSAENITFKLLNGNEKQQISIKNQLLFEADQLLGMPSEPYAFELSNCDIHTPNLSTNQGIKLFEVYPNPFDDQIVIDFEMHQSETISISLQDMNGKTVAVLYEGILAEGNQQIVWKTNKGKDLPSGVYFLNIQSDSTKYVQKLVK